jgi:hypothetical protein
MLRLGIAPYIGLGEDPNVKEFKVIWERAKNNNLELLPITLLSALLDSEGAVSWHCILKIYFTHFE